MKVFIIDDNLPLSFMLSQWFEFKGHSAEFETNPYKALKIVENNDLYEYDYILLDLLLNGIDGMKIYEAIRAKGQGHKVIIVSGCDVKTDIFQKAVDADLPIVIKTFSPEELVENLENGNIDEWCKKGDYFKENASTIDINGVKI